MNAVESQITANRANDARNSEDVLEDRSIPKMNKAEVTSRNMAIPTTGEIRL